MDQIQQRQDSKGRTKIAPGNRISTNFPTENLKLRTLNSVHLCVSLFVICFTASAVHPHRVWVQHFDGGSPGRTNQPVAMSIDSKGNIVITGTSQNSSNLLDYVTLKYSPQGTLLWSKTFGETNLLNDTPRGMEIDSNDTVYVTGTSKTVAYAADGTEKWTSPLGGRALGLTGTNLYVVGYSDTVSSTAKLDMGDGHALWTRSFDYSPNIGPNISESMVLDPAGNIYVFETTVLREVTQQPQSSIGIVKYSAAGRVLATGGDGGGIFGEYSSLIPRVSSDGKVYLSFYGNMGFLNILMFDSNLILLKRAGGLIASMPSDFLIVNNKFYSSSKYSFTTAFILYKLDENLNKMFEIIYSKKPRVPGSPKSMTSYRDVSIVVVGYFFVDGQNNNLVVLNYDLDGNELWEDQYNGIANGRDEAVSVKIDVEGNIYVAGLSTTPQGGSEIILLKYTQTAIEKKADANPKLQFPGEPGKQLKVEATPTLTPPDWTQIALGQVPTNGLFQVEDTSANLFPSRFYRAVTAP